MDGSPPNGYFMFTARTLNSEVQIVIPYGDRYDSITLDILARRALFGPQVTDSDLSMPPLEETQTLHIRIRLYQLRLTAYYHNWKL